MGQVTYHIKALSEILVPFMKLEILVPFWESQIARTKLKKPVVIL